MDYTDWTLVERNDLTESKKRIIYAERAVITKSFPDSRRAEVNCRVALRL